MTHNDTHANGTTADENYNPKTDVNQNSHKNHATRTAAAHNQAR